MGNRKKTGIKKVTPVFFDNLGCYILSTSEFISVSTSIFIHSGYICALFFILEIVYIQWSDLHLQLYPLEDVIHYVISFSNKRGIGETWHHVKWRINWIKIEKIISLTALA